MHAVLARHARAARAAATIATAFACTLVPGTARAELPHAVHQTLPNGMQLVFIEDHSTPLVSVCLWVGAGSADETGRTSGASHLLEHLLFDGTATRTREEVQASFDRIGGYVNAFTRREYTAHILSAPRDVVETAIEIQSDMLLASTFPEVEVAKERNVVLEEMKRDRDDARRWSQELFEREFWRGTPLALDPIGTEATVKSIPREEIIAYWRDHYTPDHMIALVIGDFRPAAMRALFERLYGAATPSPAFGLPRADTAARAPSPAPAPFAARREREEWLATDEVIARFGFVAPAWDDPLAPAMEIAAQLLAGGPGSRLETRLASGASPFAGNVEGGVSRYGAGSVFQLSMTLGDRAALPAAESALAAELRLLATKGPSSEELERVKTTWRVADAFERDNMLYFAMGLADWMARGGYGERRAFARRTMAVTAADVREVTRRWLAPMNALVHITIPLPAAPADSGDAGSGAVSGAPGVRTERRVLPNGLVVIGRENPASGITAIHALVGHRLALEPAGRAGAVNFMLEALAEGTRTRRADAIVRELAAIGARLQVSDDPGIPFDDYYWSPDYAFVRLEVANEFAPRALALMNDLLLHPSFPADRIDAVRQRVISLASEEESGAGPVGRLLLRQSLFAGTTWTNPLRGNASSLAAVTRDDLVALHRRALSPSNVILSFAGGASLEATFAAIEADWKDAERVDAAPAAVVPAQVATDAPPARRRMERDQMWLGFSRALPGATDPSMPAMVLATAILDRRLGLELREKQGLAYSVGAGAGFARGFGWVTVSMGTRTANHDRAITGLREAIATLGTGGVTDDELALARNATLAQRVRYRQRAIGQAYTLGLNEYLGLGHEFDRREAEMFSRVGTGDVNRAAREMFAAAGWVAAEVGRVVPASGSSPASP